MTLEEIAESDEVLEVGRKAIEDMLIDLRDSRIGLVGRGNGLVVYERDRTPSNIIRMGPETALKIGLQAIALHLKTKGGQLAG